MEVEEQGAASYVISGGSGSSVSVSLHPLVIMNISDHFTRVRVQQQDDARLPLGALLLECMAVHVYEPPFVSTVFGVLLGSQKGRSIEICNSFELVVSDDRQLDREYFTSKEEQCRYTT